MHAPNGYVDLQVNGYADIDFNADRLVAEDVARACQRLRDDGVAGILATVITADIDAMCRRLANICYLHDAEPTVRDMIWGIHIEGPFLSEQRKGVHDASKFRTLDEAALELLTSAKHGRTLVTLAPETTTPQMIARLAKADWRRLI